MLLLYIKINLYLVQIIINYFLPTVGYQGISNLAAIKVLVFASTNLWTMYAVGCQLQLLLIYHSLNA